MAKQKVTLVQDPSTQTMHTAIVDGKEISIVGGSPIVQGAQLGISLTLLDVDLSIEAGPTPRKD